MTQPHPPFPYRFILASQSPRRRELLSLLGFPFEAISVDADETVLSNETPRDYTRRVSALKIRLAIEQYPLPAETILIAADTTVADGHTILGKPATPDEATHMLKTLRGRAHQVYTATAMWDKSRDRLSQDLAVTMVTMRSYMDSEIANYIASGDPFDKAGSYAIQNKQFHPVTSIQGCYSNVVGLPLCHIVRVLRQWGLSPSQDVPQACQQTQSILCPVYEEILAGHL